MSRRSINLILHSFNEPPEEVQTTNGVCFYKGWGAEQRELNQVAFLRNALSKSIMLAKALEFTRTSRYHRYRELSLLAATANCVAPRVAVPERDSFYSPLEEGKMNGSEDQVDVSSRGNPPLGNCMYVWFLITHGRCVSITASP